MMIMSHLIPKPKAKAQIFTTDIISKVSTMLFQVTIMKGDKSQASQDTIKLKMITAFIRTEKVPQSIRHHLLPRLQKPQDLSTMFQT